MVTCGDHGDHGTSVSDEIDLKQKLVRTLGFFPSSFWPLEAEIACLCTRWPVVTMVTSVSYEIDQKRKLVRTLGFFLDFSSQLILTTESWDSLPVCLVTSGDHGDHGTSVSVGQWAYSDVSLNLTLCQWLTFWREICVISLRKVSWWWWWWWWVVVVALQL